MPASGKPMSSELKEFAPDLAAEIGLKGLADMLRDRSLTSEDLTENYLLRIAVIDPAIDAFVWRNPDALSQAKQIDRRRQAGENLGPLMGLPVAVKQIFSVADFPSSPASALEVKQLIEPEGPFMSALTNAGVVVLGLTRTTEFAAATINTTTPAPWNPWDFATKRVCGGSSHGSAAAQAAGLCAFAVGSDTGGSVRFPAAMCGVVGFKPTHGRWPTGGVFPLSPTFDTVGIFANSAADIAFICAALGDFRIVAARAKENPIFACPREFTISLDPPVKTAFDFSLEKLRGIGIRIVDLDLPEV